jgi:hypothetical protein
MAKAWQSAMYTLSPSIARQSSSRQLLASE